MTPLRRLLKLAAVALIALAVATGLRAVEGRSRRIPVVLEAPPGVLSATIRDEGGAILWRAELSANAVRLADVELPTGMVTAELQVGTERRVVQKVVGPETPSLVLDWGR